MTVDDDNTARTPADKRAAARAALVAERQALVDHLQATLPAAMRDKPQWLLWRFEVDPRRPKPLKVPYYASGRRRTGEMGTPDDRAGLATLDAVLKRLLQSNHWSGIGFAFLAGDGLIGIDVDHAIDPATGQPSDLCRLVVESCASYTELSPSGAGVHVIVAGTGETFKDDRLGLEVYVGQRYFTCTGQRLSGGVWPELPAEVQPVDPTALAYLRELVMESREKQRQERAAASAAVAAVAAAAAAAEAAEAAGTSAGTPAPLPVPPAAAAPVGAGTPAPPVASGGDDFKRVNDAAMRAFHVWVPALFSEAIARGDGYRVTSKALGRDLQEDLSITTLGIVDYGVADMGDAREGKRSPIDLVLEYGHRVGVAKPAEALRWLAQMVGIPLQRPALRRVQSPAPAPSAADDPRPEPPDDDARATAPSPPGPEKRPRAPSKGRGKAADKPPEDDDGDDDAPRRGKKLPPEMWDLVDALCSRFALVYGSDTAWDRVELMLVRIPAMRLAFGKTAVNLWLSRPAPARCMVRPSDLVFEPGQDVGGEQINMFAGLDLQPQACTEDDVRPMLDLLRHLCVETLIDGVADPVAAAMHWILCWQAVPLQRLGVKMQTACVMHGAQGTGKNLYWDAWRDLFGSYGITVGQTELEDKYNGWVSRKLAVLGDEVVSRQEMYHNKNRLKLIVTQEAKFAIRGMFMETRWESNHANVVFLSNENTPLVLEDRDRRNMVIYTPLEAETALYQSVRDFLAADGLAKWMHYLQHYPLGDFHAHTKPPMTKAKEALIEASWRPPARFAHEWLEGYIELPVRVCSAEQLYRAFRRWCDQTGAKWPADQPVFTTEVNRWVRERVRRDDKGRLGQPALIYKQISLKSTDPNDVGPNTRRKTVRCWLPTDCGPLNGVTEGAWAWESVQAFENDLYKYCRRYSGGGDDEGDDK